MRRTLNAAERILAPTGMTCDRSGRIEIIMALPQTHAFRKEVRNTLVLAGPVIGSQLGQMSMGFVDTIMVGRLGAEALAGVALGNTLFFFMAIVCTGVVQGVAPMVSQAFGAEEHEAIERSVRQGFWVAGMLSVVPVLLMLNISPLLILIGQAPDVVALTQGYLRAIVWGFLPFLWFAVMRSFVEGISRPLPVTMITILGLGLNVLGNYIFMFGKLGFPEMGLTGTGWASTCVFWFMFLALAAYSRMSPRYHVYTIFSKLRFFDVPYFKEVLRVGGPIGVSHGLEAGLFSVTALLMGTVGTASLAAHQVAIQCAAYTFMVPLGIGIAASVRVGQAIGRKDLEGARRAGYTAILLAVVFMFCAALLFWFAPRAVIGLYLDVRLPANQEVVQIATILLGVAAVFQVFDGVQVAAAGALRGLKDTRAPMIIGFFSYWVIGLTSALVLSFEAKLGAVGLWWGLVLGLAAASVLLSGRFNRKTRRLAAQA